MDTIHAAIFLRDLVGNKPTPIENFPFQLGNGFKQVKARLIELQKGYCVEGERPEIQMQKATDKNGKTYKIITAVSSADYFHAAYLGMKIKTESLPTKQS